MSEPSPPFRVPQSFDAVFAADPGAGRRELLALYAKGKDRQWDAARRIDWSIPLDADNPQELPDSFLPIAGAPFLARMSAAERRDVFRHYQAWSVSQFLHGEQAALICAAKTVQQVPDGDAKLYAATQVVDEARHVEAYARLADRLGERHAVTAPLRGLVDQVLRDARWDMTYLGMQVVIEGLALAAFAAIRDFSANPLARAVNAYVMEDEARHVAFGRLALRDWYPQQSDAERDEREAFVLEACNLLRHRFDAMDLWRTLDLPLDECAAHVEASESRRAFRAALYARIVPAVKDIGLWGPRIRAGFARMGVLGYAAVPLASLQARDESLAQALDERARQVEQAARAGDPERS